MMLIKEHVVLGEIMLTKIIKSLLSKTCTLKPSFKKVKFVGPQNAVVV